MCSVNGLTRRLDRCSTVMSALFKHLCVLCAGLVGFARRLDRCSTVMSALYKPVRSLLTCVQEVHFCVYSCRHYIVLWTFYYMELIFCCVVYSGEAVLCILEKLC